MTASALLLVLASFLACAVEAVEALTVFLAIGVTRGWRSPILATLAASSTLALLVAVFGTALARVPIGSLRLVVGALLLAFGAQWLRKSILRASGRKALRDEGAVYRNQLAEAGATGESPRGTGIDGYAFVVVFKAVFLEGLEVAFIVMTFGGSLHRLVPAAIGAALAIVVVAIAGFALRAPLQRVPENTMKMAVGLMLCSFGVFWIGEGAEVAWPGGDLAVLGILGVIGLLTAATVAGLRRATR